MNTNIEGLNEVLKKLNDNFSKSQIKAKEINDFFCTMDLLDQVYRFSSESPAKTVFDEVRNDLLSSIIFCLEGFYRHANICLRSSLELTLSYLYYYDNQYDFILWKNDCIDMTWSKLVDSDKGFLNPKFLNIVFDGEINISECEKKIREVYHLTSQYVHGKYNYMQQRLSDGIIYEENLLDSYFKISKEIVKIETLLIYIRFHKEICKNIDAQEKIELDRLMKEYKVIS